MQKSFSIKQALSYGFRTFFGHLGLFLSALGLFGIIYVGGYLIENVITLFFFGRPIAFFYLDIVSNVSSVGIAALIGLLDLGLNYVSGVPDKLLVIGLMVFHIIISSFFYGLYQINLDFYKAHVSSVFRLLLSKNLLISLFPLVVLDFVMISVVKFSWVIIFRAFDVIDFTLLPIALIAPLGVIIVNFAIIRVIELNGHLLESLKYSFSLVKGAITRLIMFSFIAACPLIFIQQVIALQILPRLVGVPLSFDSFEEVQSLQGQIIYLDQLKKLFGLLWTIPDTLWVIIMFASFVFIYKKLQEQTA